MATRTMLEARASLLAGLRSFFDARDSLEVDVPAIAKAPASDPWLDSFTVKDPAGVSIGYLLTSPETYLKRLLSMHRRPMHAIGKAYRANEEGSEHAIEFTMLEWYRPCEVSPFESMVAEIQDLVESLTDYDRPEVISYRELFQSIFDVNPHRADMQALIPFANDLFGTKASAQLDFDSLLNLLFATEIEPHLGNHVVVDFPMTQAALARVETLADDSVAKRAELYMAGNEIANGYHELTDPAEQSRRFAHDQVRREQLNRPSIPKDEALLEALTVGLPESYGVALGVDRLLKIVTQSKAMAECMTFTGHL
jgi:elongation factor P--(R)-beta-lysine ligase